MNALLFLAIGVGQCLQPEIIYPQPIYKIPYRITPLPQRVPYIEPKVIVPETPQKVPYYHKREELRKVSVSNVIPQIRYSKEIKSTIYVNGIVDGKNYRVPIINGTAPRVSVVHTNGVLVSLEFQFNDGSKFAGVAEDTVKFIPGRKVPGVEETRNSGYGEVVDARHVAHEYVAGEIVPYIEKKKKEPESTLKRPSDIKK
jgi:hypothetical protein